MKINREIIYQNLHDEMMDLIKRQDTYSLASYTLTISIWAFALETENAWIALLPLFLLIPLSLRVADFRYSVVFLSAFVGVFLEEKSNEGWEYVREEYYNTQNKFLCGELSIENNRNVYFKRKNWLLSVVSKTTFTLLSVVSIGICWGLNGWNAHITDSYFLDGVIIIIQGLVVFLQIFITIKYRDMSNLKHKLLNDWDVVYKELFREEMNDSEIESNKK